MSQSILKKITQELFDQLGFPPVNIKVKKQPSGSFAINLAVNPEKSGVLIGYHGETINSLQLILALIVHQKLGQWHRLILDINDYRDKRQQSLIEMAQNAAARVKAVNEELVMPPMGSFDRRIIHLALSKEAAVKTESVGEGKDRRLIIRPYPSQKQSDA